MLRRVCGEGHSLLLLPWADELVVYAFRPALPEFRVTGVVGPLNGPGWRSIHLEALDYDEDAELVTWANEYLREFDLTG